LELAAVNEPAASFWTAKAGHGLLIAYVRLLMLSSVPLCCVKVAENW